MNFCTCAISAHRRHDTFVIVTLPAGGDGVVGQHPNIHDDLAAAEDRAPFRGSTLSVARLLKLAWVCKAT